MKTLLLIFLASSYCLAQSGGLLNATRGIPQPNDPSGTTLYSTALVNAAGNAATAQTTDTTVPLRIVVGGAGTSGNATLASIGTLAPCTMDATVTSGGNFFVVQSTTNVGQCHPQSAAPSAGTWVIGFLHDATTTTGSTALVHVNGFVYGSTGGGGGSGTVSANSVAVGAVTYYPAAAGSTTVSPAPAAVADANGLNVGTNWLEFGPSTTATPDLGLVRAAANVMGISTGANRGFSGWMTEANTRSCSTSSAISFTTTLGQVCTRSLPTFATTWLVRCVIPWTYTVGSGTANVQFGINYTGVPTSSSYFTGVIWGPTATTAPVFATALVSATGQTIIVQNATVTVSTTGMYSTTIDGTIAVPGTSTGQFYIFATTSAGTGSILPGASCRYE